MEAHLCSSIMYNRWIEIFLHKNSAALLRVCYEADVFTNFADFSIDSLTVCYNISP